MNILELIEAQSKKPYVNKPKTRKEVKGIILHETDTNVVIATLKSSNAKTGNMIQIWILVKDVLPTIAIKNGADISICGGCKHRHFLGGGCYVNVGQAPNSVYRSYKKGNYIKKGVDWLAYFIGKSIRFGAYGDPAFIPLNIIEDICAVARNWTGYTHQWENIEKGYMKFLMSSVDNDVEHKKALDKNYRSFKVVDGSYNVDTTKEIVCPSITKKIKCIDCGLCNGAGKAKDILILAHGRLKNKVVTQ